MNDRDQTLDCLIVGGGPAGLTAALYLARFLRNVIVVDAYRGRAAMIPKTHNLAGFPDGISGHDLLDLMRKHAALYGASVDAGMIKSIEFKGKVFHIATDAKVMTARNVILATGVFNHPPPLPKLVHDEGLERGLIRYCPVCDAKEVEGKRIAVLGDTTHGFKEAKFLRHYSPWVTLIPPDGTKAIAREGIAALNSPMSRLKLSEEAVVVTLENGEQALFDTVYVALGTTPQSSLAASLGLTLDDSGYIETDSKQKTSLDGVYAVGDIVAGLDQIAVALGQAAIAATAVHNKLSEKPSHS